MTYLLLSTQLHNGLKNVKRRKSVRSTTLQQDCQRKRFLTTLLPTTWICEKSSMSMLPQLKHVDQGLSLTLFMRSDIPKGLYEWKTENKQTTRDLSILRNYAFNKGIKSIYYVRTFTDDGGEVGANQCESCVI